MANAFLLKPLPIIAASSNRTTLGVPLNVANDYAGVVWQTAAYDNVEQLTLDLGKAQPVDTIMLFGVVLAAGVNPNMRVYLAADGDAGFANPVYTSAGQATLAGSAKSVNGTGATIWQAPAAAITCRYVRLEWGGFNQAGDPLTISRAVIGQRIVPQRNFTYGGSAGVRDLGSLDFSPRGVLLRRRGAKLRTVSLSFSSLYRDEVEGLVKPLLEQLGNTDMVALVTDPAAHAQLMNRCYYGPLVGDLGVTRRNAAAYEAKINMASIF